MTHEDSILNEAERNEESNLLTRSLNIVILHNQKSRETGKSKVT